MTNSRKASFAVKVFYSIITLITLVDKASSIPANPTPYFITSNNGVSQGPIYLKGDENYSWEEDEDGFTVKSGRNRTYYYMKQNVTSGDLVFTSLKIRKKVNGTLVGTSPLSLGISRHETPYMISRLQECEPFCDKFDVNSVDKLAKTIKVGTLKNLVVLIRFRNHANRVLPTKAAINDLFNHRGDGTLTNPYDRNAPTGSVREYYLKASYNRLTIDSVVLDWIMIDRTESECANGVNGDGNNGRNFFFQNTCLREALDRADVDVDFSQFDTDGDGMIDGICFLHSGNGAEAGERDPLNVERKDRIWSHKSSIIEPWRSKENVKVSSYHVSPAIWSLTLSDVGRIGVIAHETGHFLGLPDLYSTVIPQNGTGLGAWSLMANSWGFDNQQLHPPYMDPWCRKELNWITLIEIPLGPQRSYSIQPSCRSDIVYMIAASYPAKEYLLIENRQRTCFYDSKMPGDSNLRNGGLAIYHIDDNILLQTTTGFPGSPGWPENLNHYKVALLQADGLYGLERGDVGNIGDLFSDGKTLGPSTTETGPFPNTDSYAFGLKKTGVTISVITIDSDDTITFSVTQTATRKPSSTPTRKPSSTPTRKPSSSPTRMPSGAPTSCKGKSKKKSSKSCKSVKSIKSPKSKKSSKSPKSKKSSKSPKAKNNIFSGGFFVPTSADGNNETKGFPGDNNVAGSQENVTTSATNITIQSPSSLKSSATTVSYLIPMGTLIVIMAINGFVAV